MRFYVKLVKDSEGWVAGSESTEDVGRGPTREAALEELRAALRDRFGRVEAMAPPPAPPSSPAIDLVVMT